MSARTLARRRPSVGRLLAASFAALGLLTVSASVADAAGPPKDVIDGNDGTWACEEEGGLPPEHCINARSRGNTGVILVFEPDPRGPQESISFDPRADGRPCPHDPDSDDGTWWSVSPDNGGPWVCHHRP
jgi:hypothetical protein